MKKTIKTAFALLAIMLFMGACDVMEEPFIKGAEEEKEILSFAVDNIEGVIDQQTKSVVLDLPAGTDVSHLTPVITISTYATIEPASGVTQDFTNPVYYTVTAQNGSAVQYVVEAVAHDADNEKCLLSFVVDDREGVINEVAKTVSLTLPEGTDVTHLAPTVVVSDGASVSPASGEPQDFTNPVAYTVTAQNGTTSVYTVTVLVEGGEVTPTGKTVLIKDFTGARCVNCPAAADYAHNLQHQLGEDRIFILGVHAGYQAQPVGQFPDFLTEEGTTWYNNNDSNPLFAVDHVSLSEGNTLVVEQLDAPVSNALEEVQSFEISVANTYHADTRQLMVATHVTALADYEGEFNVTVCLVEDHIVGWQIVPGGIDKEYVFRNVFRGTLNGAEGETFCGGAVHQGQSFVLQHNTTINADYDDEQCYVLVYVHDKAQGGKILQTAMQKVK